MPMEPLPDLATLSLPDIARLLAEKKLPPVDQWNPDHCGDSEMRIARDGTWYHQGSPIGREAMVRLFSTCLLYTSPSPRDRQKSRMPSSA